MSSPKFPFYLKFKPEDSLRTKFSEDFTQDFTDQLITIPSGSLLFKVHAAAEPNAPEVHIGNLILTSEITKSKYGDETLFFKH